MSDTPADDQAAIEISEPPELSENEGTAEGTSVEEQWEEARSMDGQAPTG